MANNNIECNVCREDSRYLLQWYFTEADGKTTIGAERAVCPNFYHMVEIVVNQNPYSEMPGGIADLLNETTDKDLINVELRNILGKAVETRLNPLMHKTFCDQGQELIFRTENDLF